MIMISFLEGFGLVAMIVACLWAIRRTWGKISAMRPSRAKPHTKGRIPTIAPEATDSPSKP